MQPLKNAIRWDVILILRYGIIAVALAIAAIYSAIFILFPTSRMENLVVVLVFSDPVMYGFLFTAVMILFEKDAQTYQALAVTPLTTKSYLLSKMIVFSGLALICSFIIILSAQPPIFHPFIFLTAVILSSGLFVFLSVLGVSFVRNFTQFILVIPVVFLPACIPFLSYFDLWQSGLFYLIPTQACLILFNAAVAETEIWKLFYAIIYLAAWNYLAYKWAINGYKKRILKSNRHE